MEYNYMPSIGNEKNMPVFLSYIGETEYQPHVIRPSGFYCSQIIYCTSGQGKLILNGTEYTVKANTAFYLPPNAPHEYYPDCGKNKWYTHYLAFSGYSSELIMRQLGYSDGGFYELDTKPLDMIFKRIIFEAKSDRKFGGYMASAAVYEYILTFHKYVCLCDNSKADDSGVNDMLVPVIEYIEENYSRVIELKELCDIIDVTPQYLCRMFKSSLGMRPLEFVTRKRIQMAKQLLVMNMCSIKKAAEETGYSDTSYFCTVFKKYEGISPGEYQKSRK